ncbi:MAG: efflux RND transporter periplasmic adaptor subunit [Bacteroidales bacterium]|nr:efflux RND transporter periplasmic adaptor subunit [Bacteroidales bacterium]MCF8334358.1 efflux RND transporter periplasmic adaptor subunit [Bacteroidales bacterium]
MKKKYVIIISGIVVVALIVLLIGKKQGWIGQSYEVKVAAEEAEKRDITQMVSANGKIQPEIEVKITPYISGEVVELGVKEGNEVEKGDFLARIDPEIYRSNYKKAKANLNTQKANMANAKARLAQAKARLENVSSQYTRKKELFEEEVISQAEFDEIKSAYQEARSEVKAAEENLKAAEFNVESAKASLQEAEENLNRTSIYAPNSGTISRLNVEVGERVTGASQFSAGTEIMRIANLNRMEVNVEVNENDIIRIEKNDTALIEVDAYYKRNFKGLVTEIATSAKETQGVSTDQVTSFEVKVRILPSSYKDLLTGKTINKSPFRPGMSASVNIQTETVYDALSVPLQAVVAKADTTDENNNEGELQEYLFVVSPEGIAQKHKVKTGIQDKEYIHIKEGLGEQQKVITAPYRTINQDLQDGDPVKVVKRNQLFGEESD